MNGFPLKGLLLALSCTPDPAAPATVSAADTLPPLRRNATEPPRHVLLLVIDTLRADALEHADTPVFDQLTAAGSAAEVAWSAGTWTAPSMASMFTGMPVRTHGWDFPFPAQMPERAASYPPVPGDLPLLAEVMERAGFTCTALYGNPLLGNGLGFARGFLSYRYMRDRQMATALQRYVSRWTEGERHFMYVHMFGPHAPLRPSPEARQRWSVESRSLVPDRAGISQKRARVEGSEEHYRRAYHAVVEDVDRRVGQVLTALGPHLADTMIVVTSDHGELLGEHDRMGHNHWLWEPLTAVPLIAVGAGALPERLSTAAVPDLITHTAGVSAEWPVNVERSAAAALVAQREGKVAIRPAGALGRYKGVWDADAFPSGFAAFDMKKDPGETRPLGMVPEAVLKTRRDYETATAHRVLAPRGEEMTGQMREALEMLGYLDE